MSKCRQQSLVELIDGVTIETVFEAAQRSAAGDICSAKRGRKAGIVKQLIVIVEILKAGSQRKNSLLEDNLRSVLRIALAGNGCGNNFFGVLEKPETASNVSDRKKTCKGGCKKFLVGKCDRAPRGVGACGNLHVGSGVG